MTTESYGRPLTQNTMLQRLEVNVRPGLRPRPHIQILEGISTASLVLSSLLAYSSPAADMPKGIQKIRVAPIGIGLSHLIVYATGRKHG